MSRKINAEGMERLAERVGATFDGGEDTRLFFDRADQINVWANLYSSKEYAAMLRDLAKFEIRRRGYVVYAWNDGSSFSYWKERGEVGDSNYIQVTATISIDPDKVDAEQLKRDLNRAFDHFHSRYDNTDAGIDAVVLSRRGGR